MKAVLQVPVLVRHLDRLALQGHFELAQVLNRNVEVDAQVLARTRLVGNLHAVESGSFIAQHHNQTQEMFLREVSLRLRLYDFGVVNQF